jgi:flavorubredoxin
VARTMPIELHNAAGHRCLMFCDAADGSEGVQANQFLVVDDDTGAVIDLGGNLAYSELYLAMTQHFQPQRLSAILASHADPDIVASLDRWMTATQAPVYISRVWQRFIPHFCKPGKTAGRVVPIPDAGLRIRIGRNDLVAVPAHFMHAEGNFQFWDPASRILFSGDLGVSIGADPRTPVAELGPHLRHMEAFHRRYMVSRKVLQWWAQMASALPLRMIARQHGAPLVGQAIPDFIEWVSQLECGIDLFGPQNYVVP